MLEHSNQRERFAHIIARAWSDERFRERLLSRPAEIFAEYRLDLPPGIKELRIVENTADTVYFVLPAKPTSVEHLSLDHLPVHILDSPCQEPCQDPPPP